MGRPKGSKNKPKANDGGAWKPEPSPQGADHSNPPAPPAKKRTTGAAAKAARQKALSNDPHTALNSGAEHSSTDSKPNRAIIDLSTGQIVGPDKSLDLSVSGRRHYSDSFLKSVAQCSAQAHFKAIHAEQRKAFALERGSCVHTLLEAFAKEGKDPIAGLPEMWKFYITDHLQEMNEADREKATKEYDATLEMLVEFVAENKELFEKRVRPEDVEVEFNIEVPLRVGDVHFTRTFNGKLDLVLWSEDRKKYRIIDYKTVSSQPSDNELALHAQLSLYQYAATKMFGVGPTAVDFYMLKGIHICTDSEGKSIRFSSQKHPRELSRRVPGCEITYALKVPRKTDEQLQELFDAYYAPLILKYESGIIAKEGRSDVRNRCNLCTFAEHCATVKSFPAPRII